MTLRGQSTVLRDPPSLLCDSILPQRKAAGSVPSGASGSFIFSTF